jgi:hypothetical protein
MSQSWEFAVPLYLAFIDLRKAFDSVPRDVLWQVLRAYGVPPLLVELVSDLHTGTLAAVRLGSQKGEPFSVSCGVRQGCIIAPLLFNVFIDFVVRQALARMPSTCGVSFALRANGAPLPGSAAGDPSVPIPLLMYADDMALTCSSPLELTHFLGVMDDVCAECGLCINASKTEVMAVGREGRTPPLPPIVLRGGPVKEVPRFKYLGSLISANATCEAEINARIAKAGAAFHSLKLLGWASNLLFISPVCAQYCCLVVSAGHPQRLWRAASTPFTTAACGALCGSAAATGTALHICMTVVLSTAFLHICLCSVCVN